MCSVDDPKHCGIEVHFEPRRPLSPQESTGKIVDGGKPAKPRNLAITATTVVRFVPATIFCIEANRNDQHKRGKISCGQVFGKGKIKNKIESEHTTFESSPASLGVEAPKQPRLLCREMQRTTVGGCRHTDGSLKQGGCISLQVVFEVKPGKQTSQFGASCKIVILPMGWRRDGIGQRSKQAFQSRPMMGRRTTFRISAVLLSFGRGGLGFGCFVCSLPLAVFRNLFSAISGETTTETIKNTENATCRPDP